jgi:amidohydrolase
MYKMYKKNIVSFSIVLLLFFILTFSCVAFTAETSGSVVTYTQENKEILEKLETDGKPAEVLPEGLISPEDNRNTDLRNKLGKMIDEYAPRMAEMSDWEYNNPESGYNEYNVSKMLGEELKKYNFEVTYGVEGLEEGYNSVIQERFNAKGLPTALVAKYKGKSEHPVIAFMFEADALRAPTREKGAFHGCQHNMQGAVALGTAINLAKLMEENNLPGSVWAILTPAEEIPPPDKSAMAKAGVFDGVDVLLRSHGFGHEVKISKAGLGNCCYLIDAALYEFYGKSSHAAFSPWEGRDALDAARLFLTAVDMQREHSEPEFRFMSAITKTGSAPNVVNDYVQVDHWNRYSDPAGQKAMDEKAKKIDQIAQGAAMAAFCEVKIRHYAHYYNGIEYGWLNNLWWEYVKEYGDSEAISKELGTPSGWDEGGYGSVNVPGICVYPAIANVPELAGHSDENADITITDVGHGALVQTAKISGAMALRLILDPKLLATVKEEQVRWQEYGLKSGLLTEDMVRK